MTLPGGKDLYRRYSEPPEAAAAAVASGDFDQGARLFIEAASGYGAYDRLSGPARARLMDNVHLLAGWEMDVYDPSAAITREEAAKIDLPVQLVSGSQSPVKYRLVSEELKRCIPQARWDILPASAHLPHLQNPSAFHAAVADFLAVTTRLPLDAGS